MFRRCRGLPAAAGILILAMLSALSPVTGQSPPAAKRIALVVGIDRYVNLAPDKQLQKAVNDGRAMSEALARMGFRVIAIENAERVALLRRWQELLNSITPGDEVALYFAGHGVEIAGTNYLVPSDVPKVGEGEMEVLKGAAIRLDAMLEALRARAPRVSLIVLDACRDNPFASARGRSIGQSRGLADAKPPQGTFIMYSAGAGQQALDGFGPDDTSGNSVYTRALLPLLETPGLDITEVARRVRRDVHEQVQRVGYQQTPAYYDELIGQFCPSGCEPGAKSPSSAAADNAAATAVATVAPGLAPVAAGPSRQVESPTATASPFDGTWSVKGKSKTCRIRDWTAQWRIAGPDVLTPRGKKVGTINSGGSIQLSLPSLVDKEIYSKHTGQVRDGNGSGTYVIGNCGGTFTMVRD